MTAATPADAPATQPHPTCSTCGAIAADAVPVTWSAAVEGARRHWTCDRCAREHVRSIEAKLDSSWW
ncbi:MAG: hypothetical protein ACXV0U_04030 [Kineosporiaceae bacterium]